VPSEDAALSAAVAVTPVPERTATHLLRRMAIDGRRGWTLVATTEEAEGGVPSVVGRLLWTAARRELGLRVDLPAAVEGCGVGEEDGVPSPSSDAEGYRRIAARYNRLWDVHGGLVEECTPVRVYGLGPELDVEEPGDRLVRAAGDWLLDEMEGLGRCLAHYRHSVRWK